MGNNKDCQGMQLISRAAAVLRTLSNTNMSLGSIARITNLPRSTVQRIVDALAAENLVEAGRDGVRLGWGLQHIARRGHTSIVPLARPALELLFTRTHETVDISGIQGEEVTFLDRILSDQELRVVPFPDRPRPLYAMANGKALLSMLTDEEIGARLTGRLQPLTPATLTALPPLLAQIASVRETGFSYDCEEHAPGVCAIGTPVRLPQLGCFAFSVVMPQNRYEQNRCLVEDALKESRDMLLAAAQGQ